MRPLLVAATTALSLAPMPRGPLSQEPVFAGVRVFYAPRAGFESIDARLIAGATQSIDMAAYVLTDRALVAALSRAAARGVRVRIYLDATRGGAEAALEQIALSPNVELRRKAPGRDLMHLKSYQVDGRVLRSGSANFSVSGEEFQDNDLIVIDSPAAAAAFSDMFERLWARPDNQRFDPKW